MGEFLPERFVFACGSVCCFELIKRGHKGFGDEFAAVLAETSEFIGDIALDGGSQSHGIGYANRV